MNEWFYLAFGFALLSTLHGGERRKRPGEIFDFSLELSLAFTLLIALDLIGSSLVWFPLGRSDLRWATLVLWALILDAVRNRRTKKREPGGLPLFVSRFFLVSLGSSLWAISKEAALPLRNCLVGGLALVFVTGVLEWLLEGLRERLKLSQIPEALEGPPILIWLTALLSLVFWGFRALGLNL